MIGFTVPIEPKGKSRHRTAGNGHTYTPAKQVRWEQQFALFASQYRPDTPMEGPLELHIKAVFSRPKRLQRKKDPEGLILHDKKPDIDNVVKSIADALNDTGWWRDDCQVSRCLVTKCYAEKDQAPRIEVQIGLALLDD
tara:strand:- start:71 stop:487 length:417 start_codon:yes stop_codon:yes gene_type:complete